jgi:hypothetical protein
MAEVAGRRNEGRDANRRSIQSSSSKVLPILGELFAHVGELFETSASNFSFLRIFDFFRDCSSDKLVYSTLAVFLSGGGV